MGSALMKRPMDGSYSRASRWVRPVLVSLVPPTKPLSMAAGQIPMGDERSSPNGPKPGGGLVVLGAVVVDASCSQRAEGGGVVAGLGGEVAAEAEHVGPFGQPQPGELLDGAQVEALGDEPPRMLGDGQLVQVVGGAGAGVEGADAFGGFGGVFGDLARH